MNDKTLFLGEIGFTYEILNVDNLDSSIVCYYPKEYFDNPNTIDFKFDIWYNFSEVLSCI